MPDTKSVTYDSRPDTYEHILTVQRHLNTVITALLDRSLRHDRSKLHTPEVEVFDSYTPQMWGTTYGSDRYEEAKKALAPALDHHYAKNPHHPEHWPNGMADMSLIDLIEMTADWLAAAARHKDGDIMRSIEINQERFGYGEEIKNLLTNTVAVLRDTGD